VNDKSWVLKKPNSDWRKGCINRHTDGNRYVLNPRKGKIKVTKEAVIVWNKGEEIRADYLAGDIKNVGVSARSRYSRGHGFEWGKGRQQEFENIILAMDLKGIVTIA